MNQVIQVQLLGVVPKLFLRISKNDLTHLIHCVIIQLQIRRMIDMSKSRVIYEVKDEKNRLVKKSKFFPDTASACNFFNSIKSISTTKPIIEEVQNKR